MHTEFRSDLMASKAPIPVPLRSTATMQINICQANTFLGLKMSTPHRENPAAPGAAAAGRSSCGGSQVRETERRVHLQTWLSTIKGAPTNGKGNDYIEKLKPIALGMIAAKRRF